MTINKSDYNVLRTFLEYGCTTEYKSLTIKDLSNYTKFSISQIRNIVKLLGLLEYIADGSKQGKQKTYFLTVKGLEKIEENM